MSGFDHEIFKKLMLALGPDFSAEQDLAVAVSGGPDSTALARALSVWGQGIRLHVLCVDHGLRVDSAAEAQKVKKISEKWPNTQCHILCWDHDGVAARLQEEARAARYGLMAEYCRAHKIGYLFLAHHRDDQAETLLFRLAKGSGLDGLAGMQALQKYDDGLFLVRPLLEIPKADILGFCERERLEFFNDPSNDSEKFARVRLRKAREVLEEEGLSSSRLSVTAKRLARARYALDIVSKTAYNEAVILKDTDQVVLKFSVFEKYPEEILIRCILKVMDIIEPFSDHAPRLEKVEALAGDLLREGSFRKRTLGGLIFERDDRKSLLILSSEHRKKIAAE
jgi:tRNA(Ile)-lysidine synthase